MKKSIFTTAIILGTILSVGISKAQTKTSIGIKLNGTLTNVKLTDLDSRRNKFNAGGSVGGFVKMEFNEHFALQPELLFHYTESKVMVFDDKTKFKYGGVELPVYAIGQIEAGKGKVFLGVGPHVGYGFSIDSRTEDIPDGAEGDNKVELEHWYVGWSTMVGYEFNNGLSLQAGYQMGYDVSKSHKSSDVNTKTISLGVGYKF